MRLYPRRETVVQRLRHGCCIRMRDRCLKNRIKRYAICLPDSIKRDQKRVIPQGEFSRRQRSVCGLAKEIQLWRTKDMLIEQQNQLTTILEMAHETGRAAPPLRKNGPTEC